MDPILSTLAVLGFLVIFLGASFWIFAGLLGISIFTLALILGFPLDRIGSIATKVMLKSSTSWELAAVPMFIWMGDILCRTDISKRLFLGLSPLLRRIPGGLLHTNVAGCTLFAAVSGSSTATTAAIGKITLEELRRRDYHTGLSVGSLAGAGSFGLLIPPSISMIVYGVQAEVSISKLFIAGILPGLMMAGLYSAYIMARCLANPAFVPRKEAPASGREILLGICQLLPMVVLIGTILGSIYSGIATPSEAAAVSVVMSLVIAALFRQLSWRMLFESIRATVEISCMIMALMVMAAMLSTAMGYLHMPQNVAGLIAQLDPSPVALLLVLFIIYVILGMFLDGISIILLSLPVTLPLIVAAGFDPLWFGVYLVIMIELGAMTPPVGFNLFVIKGLTGHSIGYLSVAAFPFFMMMSVGLLILCVFPAIVTWLPGRL